MKKGHQLLSEQNHEVMNSRFKGSQFSTPKEHIMTIDIKIWDLLTNFYKEVNIYKNNNSKNIQNGIN